MKRMLCAAAALAGLVVLVQELARGIPADQAFSLGKLNALPGETVSGYLEVPAMDGEGTVIPVTLIHGTSAGPVLACVAGVHAYEYPPILSLYRLRTELDPKRISGTVVLVHIANVPSFAKRTIYYSPVDWKNLNRVFPGNPDGTLSERIAHVLNTEVIGRATHVIDMHCGDGNEALIPYTYWMVSGQGSMDALTRNMALAYGIPHIIIDKTRSRDLKDSKYLGNTAILRGRPAITTEAGALGGTEEEFVRMNIRGVLGVMRLLGMLEGTAELASEPIWIDQYEVVYARETGLFTPLVQMGRYVKQGQRVGHIANYLGEVVETITAPFSGIVLYIVGTPPISRGEPVVEVGRIKD